jgi:hypothetical protein
MDSDIRRDLACLRELDHVHGLTDRQGMLSFTLPPIQYSLFKKNSRFPSGRFGILINRHDDCLDVSVDNLGAGLNAEPRPEL